MTKRNGMRIVALIAALLVAMVLVVGCEGPAGADGANGANGTNATGAYAMNADIYDALKVINVADYTADSLAAYRALVAEYALYDNLADVNQAVAAIESAQTLVVTGNSVALGFGTGVNGTVALADTAARPAIMPLVSLVALNAAIGTPDEADYTVSAWTNYTIAMGAALIVAGLAPGATVADVAAAIAPVNAAIVTRELANRAAFDAAKAAGYKVVGDLRYTPASILLCNAALDLALVADTVVTTAPITTAIADVAAAVALLVTNDTVGTATTAQWNAYILAKGLYDALVLTDYTGTLAAVVDTTVYASLAAVPIAATAAYNTARSDFVGSGYANNNAAFLAYMAVVDVLDDPTPFTEDSLFEAMSYTELGDREDLTISEWETATADATEGLTYLLPLVY